MKIRFNLFLFFSFLNFLAFSQLSGSYTVGQAGDDFPDINDAIAALQTQGVGGPVTFLVSDGEYGSLNLSDFQPLSGDSLVIRSASGNPELVRFSGGKFTNVYNVTLQDLGFYKTLHDKLSLVHITLCYVLRIKGCIIKDELTSNYNDTESTLRIEHAYEFPVTRVFIDSCHISSLDAQNHVPNEFTVNETGSEGRTYYYADTILGGWNCWNSYYREYINCYLEADEGLTFPGNQVFRNCQINFSNVINAGLKGVAIDSCHVYGTHTLMLSGDSIVNSIFDIPIFILEGNNSDVINNRFHQSYFSTIYGALTKGNIFSQKTTISDGAISVNNFFLDTVDMRGAAYHNNFGPNSMLTYGGNSPFQQNNVHRSRFNVPNLNMLGNNFSATDEESLNYAFFDAAPTFYDPEYVGANDLHIQNPALFSRGFEVTFLAVDDIDNEVRSPLATTIGADETCLQLPLRDTLFLECGTTYALKSCTSLTGLEWKPASVIGGSAELPTVLVDETKLVWLEDANGNHIDSMYLSPLPAFGSGKRTFEVACGQWGYYATYVPQGGIVSWEPQSAVSDPSSRQVVITPDADMEVIATVDLGACGVKSDTLVFVVDPAPVGYILMDSMICRTFYFHPYLFCYDSLLWDFGDGTTSNDPAISMHTFPETQDYTMSLTVWHQGMESVDIHPAPLFCVGVEEHSEDLFKLYPNPASHVLHIERTKKSPVSYAILDQAGRMLQQGRLDENNSAVDIAALSQGMYFISVEGRQVLFLKE